MALGWAIWVEGSGRTMQGWEGKGGNLGKAELIQREEDATRQRLGRSFNLIGFEF